MPHSRLGRRSRLVLGTCIVGSALLLLTTLLPSGAQGWLASSPFGTPTDSTSSSPAGAAAGGAVANASADGNFLRTDGAKIVDSAGQEVILTGINWFGLETDVLAPHGLWSRNWEEMLDQTASLGYNTIRLPYSNELFDPSLRPQGIDYAKNPDLQDLDGLQVMDKIVEGAGKRGMKVILDQHRPTSDSQSHLWYTDELPEDRWIADWQALAKRYRGNDTVIGADLHNEPAGEATWGSGDPKTDWRLAAERCGNAILEVNSDWLIVVEGVEKTEDDFGNVLDWYWMGGSLQNARFAPVRLNVPNRLVYSAHDYGPSVYMQGWFLDPEFPENLTEIWDHHWGYLVRENIAPVLVGEFGGLSVGDDVEGVWQRALVEYMRERGISYTYWALNGNSGDVGGLLGEDWTTVDAAKQKMLDSHLAPKLGVKNPSIIDQTVAPAWRPELVKSIKGLHQDKQDEKWTEAMTPEVYVSNKSGDAMSLRDVEVRYWFNPGRGAVAAGPAGQTVDVEWAGIGIGESAKPVSTQSIKAEVVADERGRGSEPLYYVKVTFGDDLSVPARSEFGVRLRIANEVGAKYFQEASYSFRSYHWPTEWERLGVLKGGKLVWGIEPNDYDAREQAKRLEREQCAFDPQS